MPRLHAPPLLLPPTSAATTIRCMPPALRLRTDEGEWEGGGPNWASPAATAELHVLQPRRPLCSGAFLDKGAFEHFRPFQLLSPSLMASGARLGLWLQRRGHSV